jgi:threonine dehydratase
VTVDHGPSFVDGIGSRTVLPAMLERARGLVDAAIVSSLADIAAAMQRIAEHARVVAEGAGACSVAAALSGRAGHGRLVCIVSGGNIDLDRFARLLSGKRSA